MFEKYDSWLEKPYQDRQAQCDSCDKVVGDDEPFYETPWANYCDECAEEKDIKNEQD